MNITIYHNPRCSKSRQTLSLIQGKGIEPKIIEYLTTSSSKQDIENLIEKLALSPRKIMRTGESIYKELNLKDAEDTQLIQAMVEHPILIERPIVITDKGAKICRPPELVEDLL